MKRVNMSILLLAVLVLAIGGCRSPVYTVAVAVSGEGRIALDSGSYLPADGTIQVESGKEISFTAEPAEGWVFTRWTGSAGGDGASIAVKVLGEIRLTAEFDRQVMDVRTAVEGNGTISGVPAGGYVLFGESITLQAVPDPGWRFLGWAGNVAGAEDTLTVAVRSNLRVIARFERMTTKISVDTIGSGTITVNYERPDQVPLGAEILLTAEPADGWFFVGWEGAGTTDENPLRLTAAVAPEMRLNALFQKKQEILWRLALGGEILSSPAAADNRIYIGSENGRLTAVDPGGRRQWIFEADGAVKASPAVGADGALYFGSRDRNFYALNPDGTVRWKLETDGAVTSSAAIGADGTIYFGSADNHLYAVNPEGSVLWRYRTGSQVNTGPTIGKDGTICFGSLDRYFYALNADGTLKWRLRTAFGIETDAALGADGTIYFGGADHVLTAVSPSGTVLWRYRTGNEIYSSPAVGSDGTIYVGSDDYHLHAVDPNGSAKWKFAAGASFVATPVIGASGTVYAACEDGSIYAIAPEGSLQWKIALGGELYGSPGFLADQRMLVIGSMDGRLYGVYVHDEAGFDPGPWPKIRGGSENRGALL